MNSKIVLSNISAVYMLTMNTTNEVFNIYKLRMLLCLCSNIRRRNLYDDKVGTVLSQLSFLSIFFVYS